MAILWYHISLTSGSFWRVVAMWIMKLSMYFFSYCYIKIHGSVLHFEWIFNYTWFCNIRHLSLGKCGSLYYTYLSNILRCLESYLPLLFTISADVNQVKKVDSVLVFLWNSFNLTYSLKWSQELLPICSSRNADHILRTTDTCYADSLFMHGRK